MLRTVVFLLLLWLVSFRAGAQADQYIIELKDKAGSPFSISRPDQFLSKRAIERRARQGIPIVDNDLPVHPAYLDSIRFAGNVVIKNVSKWLNQVCLETTDTAVIRKIASFPFVKNAHASKRLADLPQARRKFMDPVPATDGRRTNGLQETIAYGGAEKQISLHKGEFLHNQGYRGKGMLIAVIDDGFYHYQSLPAFDSIRLQNRIVDTWDFVDNKADMNEEDAHGMHCLSIIAANVPGQMIGSAPDASFLLYRSENIFAEYRGEEQNWVAAAERSDSAGADIITTSLGYNQFDNPAFDYTYADMNGRTTLMARGATIAASKGMILLHAAGNEGNKSWKYITTPGDAPNGLTVAAIDSLGQPASFTSYGPTADGRVKPDVASMGVATYLQHHNGSFARGNGTSYATPNLAGLVASLWQAFQDFDAMEIMDVVRRSSDRFPDADARLGHGVPDFKEAFQTLSHLRTQRQAQSLLQDQTFKIFPNPMKHYATLLLKAGEGGPVTIRWHDMAGKVVHVQTESLVGNSVNIITLRQHSLPAGVYLLRIDLKGASYKSKVMIE